MITSLLRLLIPTVFAADTQELKEYLLKNPTQDPNFSQGIINVGLPSVTNIPRDGVDCVANPALAACSEIPLKAGVLAGQSVIGFIILSMLKLIGAFALVGVAINLFTLISSMGNPEKIKKAKSGILYSLAGLVLALLAHAFVTALVQYFLKA